VLGRYPLVSTLHITAHDKSKCAQGVGVFQMDEAIALWMDEFVSGPQLNFGPYIE
jgi:hypothetical protein